MVDEEKAHQFLMGLNDEKCSNIRGQILALEPLTPLDKIFNIVYQENHKHMMLKGDNWVKSVGAFAVTGKVVTEKATYGHCDKYGHEESGCFEIIGYLPGWSTRG